MKIDRTLKSLLDESGAVLIRDNNHLVFRIPGASQLFVIGTTPSDRRANQNNICRLKRILRQGKEQNESNP